MPLFSEHFPQESLPQKNSSIEQRIWSKASQTDGVTMEKVWNIKITDNALLMIKVFYKYLFINPKTRITEKVLILL